MIAIAWMLGCNPGTTRTSPDSPAQAAAAGPPGWVGVTWTCGSEACEQAVEIVERAVADVGGLTEIRSRVEGDRAAVWIGFDADDLGEASSSVRERVTALRELPPDVQPTVEQARRDIDGAWIVLSGRPSAVLADAADALARRLELAPGVRGVTTCAARRRIVFEVDPVRANAFGIDPTQIADAVRTSDPGLVVRTTAAAPDPAAILGRFGADLSSGLLRRVDEAAPGCEVRDASAVAAALFVRTSGDARSAVDEVLVPTGSVLEASGIAIWRGPWVRPDARPLRVTAVDADVLRRAPMTGGWWFLDASQASAQWLPTDPAVTAAELEVWRSTPGLHVALAMSHAVELRLVGPDAGRLRAAAAKLAEIIGKPIWTAAANPASALTVEVDRVAAARFGVSTQQVADTVASSTHDGRTLAFGFEAHDPDIAVRIGGGADPEALLQTTITGIDGSRVPLSAVARAQVGPREAPTERCDRQRCVVLEIDAADAAALDLEALARSLELRPDEALRRGAAIPAD